MARLVIVSNRVPVPGREGASAGGLAVALKEALSDGALWFGWSGALSPETSATPTLRKAAKLTFATIDLSQDDYQRFYVGFANSTLWPLLHFRTGLLEFDRADLESYLAVNRAFARALAPLLRPDDLVWVHDYHLIPLAGELRALGHTNRMGFFFHVPFVPPAVLSVLPCAERFLKMLCGFDVVGFQTREHLQAYEDCMRTLMGLSPVAGTGFVLNGHATVAITTPIGIDARAFARQAKRAAEGQAVHRLVESLNKRALVIGVDRLDYSKGLPNRLEAFARLLDSHPEHRRNVHYLQIAPRSREDVTEYQRLKRDLDRRAGEINGRFAEFDWVPLRYLTRGVARTSLAGFHRVARVGLVTPLRDGMNLVAKEFVAAQDAEDPRVLVLSRFAGAAEELDAAIIVNPYDADEIAEALHTALAMPLAERKARHEQLFQKVCRTTAQTFCRDFLAALKEPAPGLGAAQAGREPVEAMRV